MSDKQEAKWYEAEINLDKVILAGITKPPFEYEKAHTYPVSQPKDRHWENREADWLFGDIPTVEHRDFRFYAHVPFCRYKCPFCFYASTGPRTKEETEGWTAPDMDLYLDALEVEMYEGARRILMRHPHPSGRVPLRDLYIGGGTPTALGVSQLERLLDIIWEVAEPADRTTFVATIECTPDTVLDADGRRKVEILLEKGITRFSLGVQSCSQCHLDEAHRRYSFDEAVRAHDLLREAQAPELRSVNVDLMYGFPRQTLQQWREELEEFRGAFANADDMPDSITFYYMRYHPDSPLSRNTNDWERVPWRTLIDMRREYCRHADSEDWRYEMCRPHFWRKRSSVPASMYQGAPCLDHGNNGAQLGFGPSAYSHIGHRIGQNDKNFDSWKKTVKKLGLGMTRGRHLSEADRQVRHVIQSLFRDPEAPVEGDIFSDVFDGKTLSEAFEDQSSALDWLDKQGTPVISRTGNNWLLTPIGRLIDEEVAYFLYPEPYQTHRTFTRGFGTSSIELNNQVAEMLREAFTVQRDGSGLIVQKRFGLFGNITPGSSEEELCLRRALQAGLAAIRDRQWRKEEADEEEGREKELSSRRALQIGGGTVGGPQLDKDTALEEEQQDSSGQVSADEMPMSLGPVLPSLCRRRTLRDRLDFDIVGVPHFGSFSVHQAGAPEIIKYKITVTNQRNPFASGGIFRHHQTVLKSPAYCSEDEAFNRMRHATATWLNALCNRIVRWDTDQYCLKEEPNSPPGSPAGVLWECLREEERKSPNFVANLFRPCLTSGGVATEDIKDAPFFQYLLTPALQTRQNTALAEMDVQVPLVLVRSKTVEEESRQTPWVEFAKKNRKDEVAPVRNILILSEEGWDEVLILYTQRAEQCPMRQGADDTRCTDQQRRSCKVFRSDSGRSVEAVRKLRDCLQEYESTFTRKEHAVSANWCHVNAVEFIFPFIYLGASTVICLHRSPLEPHRRRGSLSLSLAANPLPRGYGIPSTHDSRQLKVQVLRWVSTVAVALDGLVNGVMSEFIAADLTAIGEDRGRGAAIAWIETTLGHEVIKAYNPVLPLLEEEAEHAQSENARLIAELARTAIINGMINTPSKDARTFLAPYLVTPAAACQLAWRLFLLRDMCDQDLKTILTLPKTRDRFLSIWQHVPSIKVSGAFPVFSEILDEKDRSVVEIRLGQMLLSLLVNATKHHWAGHIPKLLRLGRSSMGRINDISGALETSKHWKKVAVDITFGDDHVLQLSVCNRCLPGSKMTWDAVGFKKGTPLVVDTACRAICDQFRRHYVRSDCINTEERQNEFCITCICGPLIGEGNHR